VAAWAVSTIGGCDVLGYVAKQVPLAALPTLQSMPPELEVTRPLPFPPALFTTIAGDRNVAMTVRGPSMESTHSAAPVQGDVNDTSPAAFRLLEISSFALVVAQYMDVH